MVEYLILKNKSLIFQLLANTGCLYKFDRKIETSC